MIKPEEYKIVTLFGTNKDTGKKDALNNCFYLKGRFNDGFYLKSNGTPASDYLDIDSWEYAPVAGIKMMSDREFALKISIVDWSDNLAG